MSKFGWARSNGHLRTRVSLVGLAGCLWVAVLLFGGMPSATRAEDVGLRRGAACDGLAREACCAQVLDTHVFNATKEQPHRRTRLVSKIACKAPRWTVPKHTCRQLLVSRGASAAEATDLCRPKGLSARCGKDKACGACRAELFSMGYSGAVAGACYGATWTRKPAEAYPIVITR